MREDIASCADVDSVATSAGAVTGDLTGVDVGGLPGSIQSIAINQPIGQASQPLRIADGIAIYVVCARNIATGGPSDERSAGTADARKARSDGARLSARSAPDFFRGYPGLTASADAPKALTPLPPAARRHCPPRAGGPARTRSAFPSRPQSDRPHCARRRRSHAWHRHRDRTRSRRPYARAAGNRRPRMWWRWNAMSAAGRRWRKSRRPFPAG